LEIRIWILFVICYLELGILLTNHCTISVIKASVAQNTSITHQSLPEIDVAVSAKIKRYVIQIGDSS
jgi:hypothetical protein